MAVRDFVIAVATVLLLLSGADVVYAASSDVEDCLSADSYNHAVETVETCKNALGTLEVEPGKLARMNFQLGLAYFWAEQYEKAIGPLSEALKLDPKLNEARVRRGRVYQSLGQFDLAYQDFSEVLVSEPMNEKAIFSMGLLYHGSEQSDVAYKAYLEALRINPNYHFARYILADYLLENTDKFEEALVQLDKLLLISREELNKVEHTRFSAIGRPVDFESMVRFERAKALWALQKYDAGTVEMDLLFKKYPDEEKFHSAYSRVLSEQFKYGLALSQAETAIGENPNCIDCFVAKMIALSGLKRFEEVRKLASDILPLRLITYQRDEILFVLAFANKSLGNYKEVQADMRALFDLTYKGSHRADVVRRMINLGYYKGSLDDPMSDAMDAGLQACMIDPEC